MKKKWRMYEKTQLRADYKMLNGNQYADMKWRKQHQSWDVELKGLYSKKIRRALDYYAGTVHSFKHANKKYYCVASYVGSVKGWNTQILKVNDLYILNAKGKQALVSKGFITEFKDVLDIMAEV